MFDPDAWEDEHQRDFERIAWRVLVVAGAVVGALVAMLIGWVVLS